jgi:outer membrane protein assembly factor BamB
MDNCIEMRIAAPGKPAVRAGVQRATYQGLLRNDPRMLAGIMKVNLSTGEITRIYTAPAPGQGAALTTDGGLLLWGDLDGVLRAFDAVSGKVLWEHRVDGPIQNSTVTYSVDGKQYVSVVTGTGVINDQVYIKEAGLTPNTEHNAIYTFALP